MYYTTLIIIFLISILGVVHTYILYPLVIMAIGRGKKLNYAQFVENNFPEINVVIAAHNEETVIEKKINSILEADYPAQKVRILIGSDNSNDRTNEILQTLASANPNIECHFYTQRQGKTAVINQLMRFVTSGITVFTDANVFLEKNTLKELVKYFKDDKVGVVCANILPLETKKEGIAVQEKSYLKFDSTLKHFESVNWGVMMGAVGGCYAIRTNLVKEVPERFIVDDFFISVNIFRHNYRALFNKEAVCYEEVSVKIAEEFRRKVRISSGNFQNLFHFLDLWLLKFNKVSFAFFSHKVLRWITPFLLIIQLVAVLLLSQEFTFFYWTAFIEICLIFITFAEILLSLMQVNILPLRYLSHFSSMNLALLVGFFKYVFGIKSSVWKPTERNQ